MAGYVVHDLTFIVDYYLSHRAAHTADALHDLVLGPELAAIRNRVRAVALPDPKTFRFQAFDLLSVPVVHE